MPRLERKSIVALTLIAGAIVIGLALIASRPRQPVDQPGEPVYAVRALEVTPEARAPLLVLYGRVTSPSRTTLTAALSADVRAVPVRPGHRATRGTILVELDRSEAEISLDQASAALQQADAQLQLALSRQQADSRALGHHEALQDLARKAHQRAQDLHRRQTLSQAQLDAAQENFERQSLVTDQARLAVEQGQAQLASARAQLLAAEATSRRAELDLLRTRIQSPYDAAVVRVHVAAGDRVNPGQALVELYDSRDLEVRAQIPDRYLPGVRAGLQQGQSIRAVIHSGSGRYRCSLQRLASSSGGGGVDAWFRIEQGELEVDSNVSLEMQLPPAADAVALPFEAIYDLSRIYRYTEGRLEGIAVERLGDARGPAGESLVLVRSPMLTAGDRIIVTHLPNAIDGLRVQLIE